MTVVYCIIDNFGRVNHNLFIIDKRYSVQRVDSKSWRV